VPKTLTPARLAIREDGTPFSADFGDVYYSTDGGPGQAEFVFLAGNGLPERWRHRDTFTVLETGFGTGLNFLATWKAWLADSARCSRLRFVSIEKHPIGADDLLALHQRWPELARCSEQLRAAWPLPETGLHTLQFEQDRVTLDLHFGDAADVLPRLKEEVDAFYLDGFAPGKNADMWSPAIFRALAAAATPGATLATWTVAAKVRKGLAEAGFSLWKSVGYGRKRDMLRGALRTEPSPDQGSRD
jgi:tRNA 5-methylaminomethyl-2-thiouridine biosynthesis bifunctional protein